MTRDAIERRAVMRRRLAEWGRVAPDIQHERVRAARRYEQARGRNTSGQRRAGSARPRTERYARRWMGRYCTRRRKRRHTKKRMRAR